MLNAVKTFLFPEPPPAAGETYIALLAASRKPFFYTELGVPDTIDGRFGMIVVHLALLQRRLLQEDPEFCRHVSEAFFADMERAVREMGVMDTGVAKRIKKMGKAYHGCLQAYAAGFADDAALQSALARNLYGTLKEGNVAHLKGMADYMRRVAAELEQTPAAAITGGSYRWPAGL